MVTAKAPSNRDMPGLGASRSITREPSEEDIFDWLLWSERVPHDRGTAPVLRRWATVLWWRYCHPSKPGLRDAARIVSGITGSSLSYERVRQIEQDALDRLGRGSRPWVSRAKGKLAPDSRLAQAIYGWTPELRKLLNTNGKVHVY